MRHDTVFSPLTRLQTEIAQIPDDHRDAVQAANDTYDLTP